MTFGEAIRNARYTTGLTQKDLALRVGISPQYINDIEKDRRNPPSDGILLKWVKALNIGFDLDFLKFLAGRYPEDLLKIPILPEEFALAMDLFRGKLLESYRHRLR